MTRSLTLALLMILANGAVADAHDAQMWQSILAGEHRSEANRARDVHRRPVETLTFFGVTPDATVVEVWPGGGWYTEILAPYLRAGGVYFAAGFTTTLAEVPEFFANAQKALANKLASNPVYENVVLTELYAPQRATMAPPGTVDFVLTFRNVHNWHGQGNADAMMQAFHRALKPGGVLGVVEHRAKPGTTFGAMAKSGYMTEQYVIDLATKHGFTLAARSEVNANAKDTTDHPAGVWTLPPNLRHCQPMPDGADKSECIARYSAIGESDRMTMKFVKAS